MEKMTFVYIYGISSQKETFFDFHIQELSWFTRMKNKLVSEKVMVQLFKGCFHNKK